jgi:DNA-binding transcriptional regulator LsrR (DeoR family)
VLPAACQENYRQIAELAQIQDCAMLTQRELAEELGRVRSDRDALVVDAKEREITDLKSRAHRAASNKPQDPVRRDGP